MSQNRCCCHCHSLAFDLKHLIWVWIPPCREFVKYSIAHRALLFEFVLSLAARPSLQLKASMCRISALTRLTVQSWQGWQARSMQFLFPNQGWKFCWYLLAGEISEITKNKWEERVFGLSQSEGVIRFCDVNVFLGKEMPWQQVWWGLAFVAFFPTFSPLALVGSNLPMFSIAARSALKVLESRLC